MLFGILLLAGITLFAQTDSLRREKVRQEIGLDYSVPDFSVSSIDEAKMGTRNAAILRSLEELPELPPLS